MELLLPGKKPYAWGSVCALQEFLQQDCDGQPLAELWYGAHHGAMSHLDSGPGLAQVVQTDPVGVLGKSTARRFGHQLPFLLKMIAPAAPLSLQVHPSRARAQEMFAAEEALGLPLDDARRNYKDQNHKPELVYALTRFEALCGFRAARRAAELFECLEAPLAQHIYSTLVANPGAQGIAQVFSELLDADTRPEPCAVNQVVEACRAHVQAGTSPSLRAYRTVDQLQVAYPSDPGVVASLLLNPVTLHPGEALFVPAGWVHAYMQGTAVELMASSDNVLRCALTQKHIDIPELLACVDYVAAPPIRLAPERVSDTAVIYYAPVDDFELCVVNLTFMSCPIPGRGARIVLCLKGQATLTTEEHCLTVQAGQAVFVRSDEGSLRAEGQGMLVQAGVP